MAGPQNFDALRQRAEGGEARAQYMLAAQLSASGASGEAEKWLEAAFRNGEPDAGYTLATRRFRTRADADDAARMLEAAAQSGSTIAKRLLGVFYAEGLGVEADWAQAVHLVIDAAKQGDIPARREIAMLLLSAGINEPVGISLLGGAAREDAVACAAYVRLASVEKGLIDHDEAQRLLQKLIAARYPNTNALSTALERVPEKWVPVFGKNARQNKTLEQVSDSHFRELALGAKSDASTSATRPLIPQGGIDWAGIERALINAPERSLPNATVMCDQPAVRSWSGAFSSLECEYIIATAAQRVAPSLIVDPETGERRKDAYRTSSTATLGTVDLDLPLLAINRRLAKFAERPPENGEFLSVLHYAPGQEYRPHFDWLPPGEDLDRGGQRVTTALLYLNDGYEGGETRFLSPDIHFKGAAGDVLVFHNVHPDGASDKSSRHAGLPVTKGAKWLGSKWFRAREYTF